MTHDPHIPEALPADFDRQVETIRNLALEAFRLATPDEIRAAAKAMGLLADDGRSIVVRQSDHDPDNAKLIEWTVFCIRRRGQSLIQLLASQPATGRSVLEASVLAALATSHWSLLHITAQRPGIGMLTHDLWCGNRRVAFTRTLSSAARVGDHILGRWVTVGTCTTMTAVIAHVPADVLGVLAQHRMADGRAGDLAVAHDPVLQDEFAQRMLENARPPRPAMPMQGGNRMRNQPCPCGSGRKFKQCCGR